MYIVKVFQSETIKCKTLIMAEEIAEEQAYTFGYADIIHNDKYIKTYYILPDKYGVNVITHNK